MREELKEWLGIKPADFAVYAAAGAAFWMYLTPSQLLDVLLSFAAIAFCLLGCRLGMKADSRLSALSNALKRIAYPGCLVVVLVCVYLNFTKWNPAI